jgi:heat shock protein HslJ
MNCRTFAVALLLTGCQTSVPPTPPPPAVIAPVPPEQLAGSVWRAISIDGVTADSYPSTIEFVDGRQAAGSLGCNRYHAQYAADALGLRFASLTTARMHCEALNMKQEERFAAVLLEARGLRFDAAGSLLLLDAAGTVRAALERVR